MRILICESLQVSCQSHEQCAGVWFEKLFRTRLRENNLLFFLPYHDDKIHDIII